MKKIKFFKIRFKKRFFIFIGLFIIFVIFQILNFQSTEKLDIHQFNNMIEDNENNYKISNLIITPKEKIIEIYGKYIIKNNITKTFFVRYLNTEEQLNKLLNKLNKKKVIFYIGAQNFQTNIFLQLLISIIQYIFLFGGIFFILSKISSGLGSNKIFDFINSRARINKNNKFRFKDVAGAEEEKNEMQEIIKYLKFPKKFNKMGARVPKGMLLQGAPGTGKTLLAKAAAGEAKVPFYIISGSDFVEMFVGVGASRVRNMFKKAKLNAPCIIFIDEIDAVGRQRGAGLGGGHDEREQTLNQLLVEMDGIEENSGIVILAATNRPDVLDPALLRPGRFDRTLTINLPDIKGREEILKVHSKNKILSKNVSLKSIARRTPTFSGADLENVLNEAAILAVRNNKKKISMKIIDEAIDRVIMGPAKISKRYTKKEQHMVAVHEAGHTVVGLKLNDADKVQKVTIIPRGNSGGYNLMTPKKETFTKSKSYLLDKITGYMGGRAAEEIFFNEISTGSNSDIKSATNIARSMVMSYGMSDLGPVEYGNNENNIFLGRDYRTNKNFSNKIAYKIDKEVQKIINKCFLNAKKIISKNTILLKKIVKNLLKYETLTFEEIEKIVNDKKKN